MPIGSSPPLEEERVGRGGSSTALSAKFPTTAAPLPARAQGSGSPPSRGTRMMGSKAPPLVIASAAKQPRGLGWIVGGEGEKGCAFDGVRSPGLLRRDAPRNDAGGRAPTLHPPRSPQAGVQWAAFRLCEMIWVPAFAGNTDDGKQGPHPTLSHRERALSFLALAPLGERVG